MTTAKLKAEFSSVVSELRQGHEVAITYGRNKEPLATIIPQSKIQKPGYSIKPGTLQKKAGHISSITLR
jgi:antitoxin (DNA-binding transcriptional repressor) of toxin-antitoxin stability system